MTRSALPGFRRGLVALSFGLVLLAACQSPSPTASPTTAGSAGESPNASVAADLSVSQALRDAVDASAIRAHLDDLLAIAQAHDGIRAAGTAGYDASVEYVAEVLAGAGYQVTRDEFTFPFFTETAPPAMVVGDGAFGEEDLHALIFSASGDLTASVATVALDDAGHPTGSSGCRSSDWRDFPAGSIALTGPGGCFTRDKVEHAITAGAAALVMANPAWPTGEVRRPTLLYPEGITIPALGASAEVGSALRVAAAAGTSVHLSVQTLVENRVTTNVIAELAGTGPGGTADEVVMVGGHLDSVLDGPGINDNGSGTMTIVELARQLAALGRAPRTARFAFWSGEELGLYGSRSWVGRQSRDDLDRLVAYLNFDMVASPNYAREVYDSSTAVVAARDITAAFGAYFDAVGLTWQSEDLGGASDHAPFEDALVPTGGLFTGASEPKTDEQAALFGGRAGASLSPCYHLACDTLDEVNDTTLDEMSDAAAHVLMLLLSGTLLSD